MLSAAAPVIATVNASVREEAGGHNDDDTEKQGTDRTSFHNFYATRPVT